MSPTTTGATGATALGRPALNTADVRGSGANDADGAGASRGSSGGASPPPNAASAVAGALGALEIRTEHRFFGASVPLNDSSVALLRCFCSCASFDDGLLPLVPSGKKLLPLPLPLPPITSAP